MGLLGSAVRAGTRSIGATPPTARRRQHVQMHAPQFRCFGDGDPLYERYHDEEWGFPVRGDVALYERITLEAFQSGLSWITILRKRDGSGTRSPASTPRRSRRYGEDDVARLMADAVDRPQPRQDRRHDRQRRRPAGAARARRSLTELVWSHAPAEPRAAVATLRELPAQTPESTALAKALTAGGLPLRRADDRVRLDAGVRRRQRPPRRAVRCAHGVEASAQLRGAADRATRRGPRTCNCTSGAEARAADRELAVAAHARSTVGSPAAAASSAS